MPGFDRDQLLEPVSETSLVGENLEYDPHFSELERAAAGVEERYSGKEVIPAKEPDWKGVCRIAPQLFARSKDLRVAVRLASAEAALEGVDGLAAGIALIRALLDRYWEDVHPKPEPDDDNDPLVRLNALAPLADLSGLLGILRKTYLVEAKSLGRFTFRDLDIAERRATAAEGEGGPTADLLLSALIEAGADYAQAKRRSLQAICEDLRAIDAIFIEKTQGRGSPNFDALERALSYGIAFLAKGIPKVQDDLGTEGAGDGSTSGMGALRSRDDVKRILEQVCTFIERTEPSNPAPILIRRAQRLLDRNFMDIIQDLAPDAVAQIEKLAGTARLSSDASNESPGGLG